MFWGLNLRPNRKYSQTATKSFHISQAALDGTTSQGDANQIFITCENQKFLICTLRKDVEQVLLDLNFKKGDEVSFQSVGSGNVTLSGYIIEQLDSDFESEEDDEDLTQDLRNKLLKKAKASLKNGGAAAEEDDDEDEDDSDFEGLEGGDDDAEEDDDDDDDEEEDDDEEDDDDDEEEDDESEEEEIAQPKAKQPKLEKSEKPQKAQNGVAAKEAGKKNKDKKQKEAPAKQQPQQTGERTITGGVKIEDIRVGTGPEAKTGKRAQVFYEGRLKSNNKVFDSLKQGSGFKFGLGRGEVIKGWDVGVVGMKVGGKRRITCPPHMAYGARGSPPTIPPNSTLVFEVELKGVN